MDQKECGKIFAEWLSAYANHLHLVRQGKGIDFARPDASTQPPSPPDKSADGSVTRHKSNDA